MFQDLKNKRVIISGSTQGIGLAVARLFASMGATVTITSYRQHDNVPQIIEELEQLGGKASYHQVDFSDGEACKRFVDEFVALYGGIDVLINNVGGLVDRVVTEDIDEEFFENVANLNMMSAQNMTKYCLPYLKESAQQDNWSSSVISVGSIAVYSGGGPGASLYAASKGWLHTINRHWAKRYAKDNVRFNIVSPGVVETAFHADKDQAARNRMAAGIPLGRLGSAEEMAPTFAFLASHSTAGYITGQIIDVNGGQSMQ